MDKAKVVELLEKYKDEPIVVGLSDEGQVLYGNIDSSWLFIDGDNLVQVGVNTSSESIYGINVINQMERPFNVKYVPFDVVNYIKSYISNEPGDIADKISGLTPAATSKSFDEIKAEIEGNSIRKACSPRGPINTAPVGPGTSYGEFKGSVITTDRNGIPAYFKDTLIGE